MTIAARALALVATALLAAVAVGAVAGDAWPPLVVVNLARWWLYVLAGACAVPALCGACRRALGLPGLVAAGLALAALWPLARADAPPSGPAPADALVVVAYNIEQEGNSAASRSHNLDGILRDASPDLVLLEQVNDGLAEGLREDAPLAHVHLSPPDEIGERTAVLSRFPITAARAVRTPGRPTSVVTVTTFDGPLQVVPLHLTSPCYLCWDGLTNQAATRVAEVEAVLAALGPGPAILGGDLNSGPANDAARAVRAAGLADAHSTGGEGLGLTRTRALAGVRIDMLFGRGWRAVRTFAGDARQSDHRPVVAVFEPVR